jgi:hypothetical protein
MTLAATLTDTQILKLFRESVASRNFEQAALCQIALGNIDIQAMRDAAIKRARAECAHIISEAEKEPS